MIRVHTGAAEHHLKDGRVMRFTPSGPLLIFHGKHHIASAGETKGFKPTSSDIHVSRRHSRRAKPNLVERYGGGGYSARLFVGLNVGKKEAWTVEEVVEAVTTIREAQGAPPDASFIAQVGTYTQADVGLVRENSVQIIVIDTQGVDGDVWHRQMIELADKLRERFVQDSVILELQDKGVVTDVYGARG